jgi:glyoxylase I family protein
MIAQHATLRGPHHIALKVADLNTCERFYTEVLGLGVIARHADGKGAPRAVWFSLGETILMLERGQGNGAKKLNNDAHGWHLVAMRIERDAREMWKSKLSAAGVSLVDESDYSIYFNDPEGNRLALSHYPFCAA